MTKLTLNRLSWLGRLADDGPQYRPPRNRVGYDCMHAGWTEWDWRDSDTLKPLTFLEAQEKYGTKLYSTMHSTRKERLTDLGREVLEKSQGRAEA